MNKITLLYILILFGLLEANAQKKAGYFGKKFYVGWEHSIRPFGNLSAKLSSQNIGLGKIKIEKLINRNRTLGLSFEKMDYMIIDGNPPDFPLVVNPQRYLSCRSYGVFLKKFYMSKGIAPIGSYSALSLTFLRNSIDTIQNGKKNFSSGDLYFGYELGRSFPLLGKKLIANVSVGLYLSAFYILELDPDNYNYNNTIPTGDLATAMFGMNVIKANVGISYALF